MDTTIVIPGPGKTLRRRIRRLVLYGASFVPLSAILLAFFFPVWSYLIGGKLGLQAPAFVPVWKAGESEACVPVLIGELTFAAILALAPYLGLKEWDVARHRPRGS